jgi:hypothetical protein
MSDTAASQWNRCNLTVFRPACLQKNTQKGIRPPLSPHAQDLKVLHAHHCEPQGGQHVADARDITSTAAYGVAQRCSADIGMEAGVCHNEIHSVAQRVAHAAQGCDIVQLLIALPGIPLYMSYDAAEHIRWQVDERHACSLMCRDGAARNTVHAGAVLQRCQ